MCTEGAYFSSDSTVSLEKFEDCHPVDFKFTSDTLQKMYGFSV